MRYFWAVFTAFFMLLEAANLFAGAQPQPFLPESCDPVLQKGLEDCLTSLRLNEAVQDRNLSVVLVDITDPDCPRLAYANPNHMMYAASLPKIAILLGAFERIGRGEMVLDAATLEKLTQMIRRSSNDAATEMLNRVGQDFLLEVLQSPRYRLYDPDTNGGLWVGKEYSKSSARRRDPLHQLSHGATALQVARFYYLLETGQLVSPEHSRTMKEILGKARDPSQVRQGPQDAVSGFDHLSQVRDLAGFSFRQRSHRARGPSLHRRCPVLQPGRRKMDERADCRHGQPHLPPGADGAEGAFSRLPRLRNPLISKRASAHFFRVLRMRTS